MESYEQKKARVKQELEEIRVDIERLKRNIATFEGYIDSVNSEEELKQLDDAVNFDMEAGLKYIRIFG